MAVKNTDKKSLNSVFSRLSPPKVEYMNPISVSPVTCDLKSSPRQIPSSFINYKIEIANDSMKKRKLDDSSHDDGYSSSGKKPRVPVSPDLGCFMDYSSLLKRDSMSPFTPSNSTPSTTAQACSTETKATGTARLDLEQVEPGISCPKDEVKTEHSPNTQNILLRLSPAFDYNVDDILCIEPLSHEAKEGSKETKPDLVVVEDDKGYVSTSNDQQEQRPAESPTEPPRDQGSFLNNSLNRNGSLLKPANSSLRCLEGDEEELWNIGAPLFESSVCQSGGALEHRRKVSEAAKEPEQSHHGYMTGDSTLETSYEDSLPLQVQVKSKVEIPGRSVMIKAAEEEKAKAKNVRRRRSNIWNNNAEMDHQKRRYVDSVTSHMVENQNMTQGFVSELQNLMTHVSEQTGSHGDRWQHPSDLTRRNYQKRSGSETPLMTLGEWQDRNSTAHKRFCKIPKIFDRSPFP